MTVCKDRPNFLVPPHDLSIDPLDRRPMLTSHFASKGRQTPGVATGSNQTRPKRTRTKRTKRGEKPSITTVLQPTPSSGSVHAQAETSVATALVNFVAD